MAGDVDAWGVWDDYGIRCVKAEGITQEEALQILRGYDGDQVRIVPVRNEPVTVTVWDCEFEGPRPCGDPNCKHEHQVKAWMFDVQNPDDEED